MDKTEELKILCDNIRLLSQRIDLSDRQRKICLSQFSTRLLTEKHPSPEQLYQSFAEALPNRSCEDLAGFCVRMSQSAQHQGRLLERILSDAEEETSPGAHGRIAFVRNRYNEKAFSIFESLVVGARTEVFSSFTDVCEDVFDNRSEFCILPVENTGDGRLFGFYSMIDRYELKICASCTLENEHAPDTVRYALVGKHLPTRIPKAAPWMYECSVVSEHGDFPYDIFRIANIFSAKLLQVDSLAMQYDDRARRIYFTFQADQAKAAALDLYLSEEHPSFASIGLYPVLQNNERI